MSTSTPRTTAADVPAPRRPRRRRTWPLVAAGVAGALGVTSWLVAEDRPAPGDDGPRVLWSGSFDPAPGSTWEEESGVVVASRTSAEVVEEGPEGRRDVLRVTFGEDGSRWGADYRHSFDALGVGPREEVRFGYDVYFPEDFEFRGDGKFGGLAGIDEGVEPLETSSGGSYDEGSFSVRAMWREDRSVVMYLYARHGDGKDFEDPANYGYGIVESFENPDGSTAGAIEPGRWHRVEHRVRMNTPGRDDGVYEMWIDGHRGVSVTDVQYRTAAHPDLRVNQIFSAWFFGGDSSQYPTRVSELYTDDWALTDGSAAADG
ncbi:polysaccharide lyase [Kineococcus gypseus]|uniref:polysaccharide lyase n=1 Tax=Kineococcus gypseus TaxID=1637102 RepID=UPI003D7ED6C6